jgi:hypothetical protein
MLKTFKPIYVYLTWIIFIVFMIWILPVVAQANVNAGLTESIDTNFSFNPTVIRDIIIAYGEEGRTFYLIQRWTFDAVYPLVYGLPLSFSLWGLLKNSEFVRWSWLPMFASTFDYLENIAFSLIILSYPSLPLWGITIAIILSALKWMLLGGSFLFLMVTVGKRFLNVLQKNYILKK